MTLNEAKNILINRGFVEVNGFLVFDGDKWRDAIAVISKWLEQQPCDDWYDVPSDEMTLEQARQAVKDLRKKLAEYLEQKPCADLISRQAVLSYISNDLGFGDEENGYDLERKIAQEEIYNFAKKIPSVTPKEKTGRWIKMQNGDGMFPMSIVCSKCNNENSHLDFNEHAEPIGKVYIKSRYCPNCGARMVSE